MAGAWHEQSTCVVLLLAPTTAASIIGRVVGHHAADEFNTLDLSFWRHEITMGGGGNGEFQMYVNNRTNSYVRDGILYIRPRFTADWIGEANVQVCASTTQAE